MAPCQNRTRGSISDASRVGSSSPDDGGSRGGRKKRYGWLNTSRRSLKPRRNPTRIPSLRWLALLVVDIYISLRGLPRNGGDRETVRDSSPSRGLVETLVAPTADGPKFLDHRAVGVVATWSGLRSTLSKGPQPQMAHWRSPRNAMANQTLLFFTEACICCWDVNSARQVTLALVDGNKSK
ncbi:hypothetical protein C4D60_Mb03t04840 [Musa balbisiana]|uniref:Uncharacterized protein n=1 Tax=Musa balbisiana TaxID=52838 RepID=A0A4S8J7J9_MUSBA|nr:hypothetical protein C4D60_Mb03t04840 [Musa balbisiana]